MVAFSTFTLNCRKPITTDTVLAICSMIRRNPIETESGLKEHFELLAASRTAKFNIEGTDFCNSAMSWLNVLFDQYLNGKLKDENLIAAFDEIKRVSDGFAAQCYGHTGPFSGDEADVINSVFQSGGDILFGELLCSAPVGTA